MSGLEKRSGLFVLAWFILTYAAVMGAMTLALLARGADVYMRALVSNLPNFLSLAGICALAVFLLYLFAKNVQPEALEQPRKLALMCALVVFSFAVSLTFGMALGVFLRPVVLVSMLAAVLLGKRLALFTGVIVNLLLVLFDFMEQGYAITANWQWIYMLLSFAACSLAAVLTGERRRLAVVFSVFKIGIPSAALVMLAQIMFGQTLSSGAHSAGQAFLGVLLSVLLFLALLPVFEIVFNVLTVYRITELTDHNRTLIKRMINEAPGTFNHVLVVSNLAESCALAIGEDPRLTRAAAYYHDIGKLAHPEYFKENQKTGNPHDQLTPELSTSLIKKHTTDGYALAKKHGLPEEIAAVTREHHGTLPIKYFYYRAQKYTDGTLSMDAFRYDGPKPSTKIAAIIMIADACEAAVRALSDHSHEKVEETVRSIIEERIELEQFTRCDITFKDVYTIRDTIVNSYAGFYHDRVQYPKFKLSLRKPTDEEYINEEE